MRKTGLPDASQAHPFSLPNAGRFALLVFLRKCGRGKAKVYDVYVHLDYAQTGHRFDRPAHGFLHLTSHLREGISVLDDERKVDGCLFLPDLDLDAFGEVPSSAETFRNISHESAGQVGNAFHLACGYPGNGGDDLGSDDDLSQRRFFVGVRSFQVRHARPLLSWPFSPSIPKTSLKPNDVQGVRNPRRPLDAAQGAPQKAGVHLSPDKPRVLDDLPTEGDRRTQVFPLEDELVEGAAHAADCLVPRFAPHDEFCHEGVVVGALRPRVLRTCPRVRRNPREVDAFETSRRGKKSALGIFGVDPAFDGPTSEHDVFLTDPQGFAGGEADRLADDVDPCNPLGHRMLYLQARVHLDEEELPVRTS